MTTTKKDSEYVIVYHIGIPSGVNEISKPIFPQGKYIFGSWKIVFVLTSYVQTVPNCLWIHPWAYHPCFLTYSSFVY